MIEAVFYGQVIARSDRTVAVEDNLHFQSEGVRNALLRRWWVKSLCPWKGIASYYTVEVDDARDRNAARTYRHPSPLARRIKNHIAFWHCVRIVDAESGSSVRPGREALGVPAAGDPMGNCGDSPCVVDGGVGGVRLVDCPPGWVGGILGR